MSRFIDVIKAARMQQEQEREPEHVGDANAAAGEDPGDQIPKHEGED